MLPIWQTFHIRCKVLKRFTRIFFKKKSFLKRPRANAMANTIQGMGYENTDTYYKDCDLEFLNIQNIHVMRDSLNKLYSVCQSLPLVEEEDKWLFKLDSTHWLDHIRCIMSGAKRTVQLIEEGCSLLLHCSVGFSCFMEYHILTSQI